MISCQAPTGRLRAVSNHAVIFPEPGLQGGDPPGRALLTLGDESFCGSVLRIEGHHVLGAHHVLLKNTHICTHAPRVWALPCGGPRLVWDLPTAPPTLGSALGTPRSLTAKQLFPSPWQPGRASSSPSAHTSAGESPETLHSGPLLRRCWVPEAGGTGKERLWEEDNLPAPSRPRC